MGTNFYLFSSQKSYVKSTFDDWDYELTDEPEFGYQFHIAKTSAGWHPLFQGSRKIHSVADIKKFYDTGNFKIIDEYGDVYTWPEFTERVLKWGEHRDDAIRHTDYSKTLDPREQIFMGYFVDDEGYEFTNAEFL